MARNRFSKEQLEKIELNKYVADFMGEKPHTNQMLYLLATPRSWDDVMAIAKKFDELDLDCPYYAAACDRVDDAVTTYDIDKAYAELCKAIKWYQLTNTTNNDTTTGND